MEDAEKTVSHRAGYSSEETSAAAAEYGHNTSYNASWTTRFVDSFKRDPNAHAIPKSASHDGKGFDIEAAAAGTAESPLSRSLKGRHLQMIAIGGSIGMFTSQSSCLRQILTALRYWSLRRIWQLFGQRWSCISSYCIRHHWYNVVLHRSCFGRDGCALPRRWFLLRILDPLSRPRMGICYGLEVSKSRN